MSNDNSGQTPGGRRASFSQSITDIFGRAGPTSPKLPGPITTAAANAQRRRMSMSGGSPTSAQNFFGGPLRRESMSSSGSSSASTREIDENAIDDDVTSPLSPSAHARRVSFGARALRDARSGGGNSPPTGFNWSEGFKSRAENGIRGGSVSSAIPERRRSEASSTMPAPPTVKVPEQQRPDAFQERILKGDFYMD